MEKNTQNLESRIPVTIDKGFSGDDPNLLVSVNGRNYILPRGKTSLVPPEVAYEVARSRRAQEKLDANMDRLIRGEAV